MPRTGRDGVRAHARAAAVDGQAPGGVAALQVAREELDEALGRPTAAGRRYLDDVLRREPLPAEEERRLVTAAKRGDPGAREQLIEAFMPRIASVARLYRASPVVQRQELLQEGVIGLLEALETFDPQRGTPFWAYARWHVIRAMRRLVSELARPIVLSDRALRQLGRLRDAEQRALAETGREPSRDELAERAQVPRERADALLRADRPPRFTSETVRTGEGEPVARLEDQLADPRAEEAYERLLDQLEARELLALLSGLSQRDRMVLRARHGLDGGEQSSEEIGERLGLSGDRVRQIEQRARRKLAVADRDRGAAS